MAVKAIRSVQQLLFIIVTTVIIIVGVSACRTLFKQSGTTPELYRYEFSHPQMGTLFRIVLYAPSDTVAQQAAQAAFRRVDELNEIMSDYLATSELSKLSATSGTGQEVSVSNDLWAVLKKSMDAAVQTKGAFDITVGPYVSLWRRARRQQELPSPEALAIVRQKTGYQHIRLNPGNRTVELMVPGMKLDLGGIGKGYAADEAFVVLKKYGITTALVDAGGNIVAGNVPPGKKGWEIAVVSFASGDTDRTSKVITFSHAAVATSGDLYQYVEINGKRYSHIVDPRTGIGLTDQTIVTVLAPDGTTADYLSTAVSVLGPVAGLVLVEKNQRTAAIVLKNTEKGIEKWESEAWKNLSKGQ